MSAPRDLFLPPARVQRWVENFIAAHGETTWQVADGVLRGGAADGSWCEFRAPFNRAFAPTDTAPDLTLITGLTMPPERWGVLLVRKGGFAAARLEGATMVEHKVGQRHVQGRTKAGGQSQQRFARRRDNQARQAYEAAGGHGARILGPLPARSPLVVAGDGAGLGEAIAEARLEKLSQVPLPGGIADPRRVVLDEAIAHAQQVQVRVQNA